MFPSESKEAAAELRRVFNLSEASVICDAFSALVEQCGFKLRLFAFGLKKSFCISIESQDGGPAIVVKKQWDAKSALSFVDRVLAIKLLYKVSYKVVLSRYKQLFSPEFNIYAKFASDYAKAYDHDLKDHYEIFSRVQHILGLTIEQARQLVWD